MAADPGDSRTQLDTNPSPKLVEESLTWREVDGEIVVLDRRNWMYMSINDSGALLWMQIIEGAPRSQLAKCLREAYEIDDNEAEHGVESFLETLRSHNLLVEDGAD
jgi:Coenzyme PQQ synthesis protein D (PqqD)